MICISQTFGHIQDFTSIAEIASYWSLVFSTTYRGRISVESVKTRLDFHIFKDFLADLKSNQGNVIMS